jgi:hypothetical protein
MTFGLQYPINLVGLTHTKLRMDTPLHAISSWIPRRQKFSLQVFAPTLSINAAAACVG